MDKSDSHQKGWGSEDWMNEGEGIISQRTYMHNPWSQTVI